MVKVHQVAVKKVNACGTTDWEILARNQFLSIPSDKQIELILNGSAKFYDDAGNIISINDAIAAIGLI